MFILFVSLLSTITLVSIFKNFTTKQINYFDAYLSDISKNGSIYYKHTVCLRGSINRDVFLKYQLKQITKSLFFAFS